MKCHKRNKHLNEEKKKWIYIIKKKGFFSLKEKKNIDIDVEIKRKGNKGNQFILYKQNNFSL